jgi:adenylate cyclase
MNPMNRWVRLGLTPLRLACLMALLLGVVRWQGCRYLDLVDARAVDYRLLQRGARSGTAQVVIVGIDDRSLAEFGRWPWSRARMALLVEALAGAKPAVIGFDIVQSEPTESFLLAGDGGAPGGSEDAVAAAAAEDDKLAAAVQASERAVLGYFFEFDAPPGQGAPASISTYNAVQRSGDGRGVRYLPSAPLARTNLPALTAAARETGYFNFFPDDDGVCRRVPLAIRYGDQIALPLSLSIWRASRPGEAVTIRLADFGVESIRAGTTQIPVAEDGQMLINYQGPGKSFTYVSASDVLHERVDPGVLRDKLVLVGVTAAGVTDVRVTPFDGVMPGVEIHANVLDNLLRGDFVWHPRWAILVELAAIVVLAVSLGVALHYARGIVAALFAAGLLAAYMIVSQWVFVSQGLPLTLIYPILAVALTYSGISLQHYVTEEREKRKIRDAFGLYLSPSLARLVSERPEMLMLGGDKRELTVLFSDIRGFTTMSEGLEPETLVEILNEFLGEMTDVIFTHDGTLDKYIGDAIMAVWGAPVPQTDHAARACRAALGMVARLRELNTRWQAAGRPRLDIGIGLNTGPMVVGNMGSARRLSYTVIGDNVNLGSRLEGLNKIYGTHIIASEATVQAAAGVALVRELDLVRVKGKRLPVRIYELVAEAGAPARWSALLERSNAGIAAYRALRWDEAEEHFAAILREHPDDGPARLYLERCAECRANPPGPDWDAVTVMDTK